MERTHQVDLSIILDTETLKITGDVLLDGRLSLWQEAARRIAPKVYEIILCSEHAMNSQIRLPDELKTCVRPGSGYYGLKTAGGKIAQGDVIFWSDIDCRPDPDYFLNLLKHFSETDAEIIGGRTFYDHMGFNARAHTAISWGYLHGIDSLGTSESYLGHNVACKQSASGTFFGPYTGRYGGDEYITSIFRHRKDPLLIFQDLIVYHESPSHSLRGLMDRHLREIGRNAAINSNDGSITASRMMREARRLEGAKWHIFKQHASKFGFAKSDYWKVRLLLKVYAWLDFAAACLMSIFPSLLHRWAQYQFGPEEKCMTVNKLFPKASSSQ